MLFKLFRIASATDVCNGHQEGKTMHRISTFHPEEAKTFSYLSTGRTSCDPNDIRLIRRTIHVVPWRPTVGVVQDLVLADLA